jgi:penicillin-binding protein 2
VNDRSALRIVVLRVMVVSILLTLLGRLAYLQVVEGPRYRAAASNNRIREVVTPAARGQVLDDMGRPLVSNRTALVVSVTRSIVHSQPHRGKAVLARLSTVIGISPAQIEQLITPCGEKLKDGTKANHKTGCWNGSPYQPVPVASYAVDKPAEVARVLRIEEHAEDFPGVQAEYRAVREYPGGSLAAHVLGYLGPLSQDDLKKAKYQGLAPGTLIGRAGVEAVYDDRLRGQDGVQRLLVDKDSTVTGSLGTTPAVSGDNLVLSLDAGVQKVAEDALAAGIAQARSRFDRHRQKNFATSKGAAIVVEATTGRVVAMASYPSYDPTLFVGGISTKEYTALQNAPGSPLISNAVQGRYSPGSTFKIVSTAAAVAAGYPLTGRVYPCPPSYKIGASVKHNFEGESFGTLDFHDTLVRSCDTVYYKLAVEQWSRDGATKNTGHAREVFAKMARAWGFGHQTGIDLPDERAGLITDRAFKQAFWEQRKADYCAGAKRRPKGTVLQQIDAEFCTDGWRYNAGDAANFVIGQGDVLVTPLQLTMAYAALINGGILYRPQLAKGFLSADGRTATELPPVRVGKVPVGQQVLNYIKNALAGVVVPPGTAKGAFAGFPLSTVAVGGKTGTADVLNKAPTSWFASFAPVASSRYVTVVMVPEAGTGGTTAAPIARKIWDGMYGLEHAKRALLPGGTLPTTLPVVLPDGSIGRPGTTVPRRPVTVVATPSPTTQALGPVSGLPWADVPRRRSW